MMRNSETNVDWIEMTQKTYLSSSFGLGMNLIHSRLWKLASIQLLGACWNWEIAQKIKFHLKLMSTLKKWHLFCSAIIFFSLSRFDFSKKKQNQEGKEVYRRKNKQTKKLEMKTLKIYEHMEIIGLETHKNKQERKCATNICKSTCNHAMQFGMKV